MEDFLCRVVRKRAWTHDCDGCWYLGTLDVKEEVHGRAGAIRADFYRCRPFVLPGRFWWSPDWSDYVCRYGNDRSQAWAYPGGILKHKEATWSLLRVLRLIQYLDEVPTGSLEAGFAVLLVTGMREQRSIQVVYSPFVDEEERQQIEEAAVRVEQRHRGAPLSARLLVMFFREMEEEVHAVLGAREA